jgi:hypothetical protein
MKYTVQIVDNFYEDAQKVRNFALQQKFVKRPGNYPGVRTDRISNLNLNFFKYFAQKLTALYFNNSTKVEYDITTLFQSIDGSYDTGWIHTDLTVDEYDVAGVVYLSPQAPIGTGTGIFRSKTEPIQISDIAKKPYSIDNLNNPNYNKEQQRFNDQFECTVNIGNVFNRLVVYPAEQWHTQMGFFGTTLETSRLTQVFFAKFKL